MENPQIFLISSSLPLPTKINPQPQIPARTNHQRGIPGTRSNSRSGDRSSSENVAATDVTVRIVATVDLLSQMIDPLTMRRRRAVESLSRGMRSDPNPVLKRDLMPSPHLICDMSLLPSGEVLLLSDE
ncbi:unnamed protein product [Linum trigynum]|uniref:Uncharacterized protein n=1 Tax=Linum trigynum TaxID=586398 RepID=A0AAV2F7T4_9ROSI